MLIPVFSIAQIGGKNMNRMNTLLKIHGGDNAAPLSYQVSSGFIEQKVAGYTDHYTIDNIKKIVVNDGDEGSTVQFICGDEDDCISHTSPNYEGTNLPSLTYFFTTKNAANEFARLADEIIRKDFNKKPYLVLTIDIPVSIPNLDDEKEEVIKTKTEPIRKEPVKKEVVKKKNHLSLDAYNDQGEVDFIKTLSKFGQQLMQIHTLAEQGQLNKLKTGQVEGVYQSRIKLPKAKKNYINQFKGADCFIAEFGTKKYYEDLEELYLEIKDEIEETLPEEYEPIDMAYEEMYENSDDEVFHTEYYSAQNANKPSIVIRIAPDGKRNTLFLRVGKK
jgi:hypothetical protein